MYQLLLDGIFKKLLNSLGMHVGVLVWVSDVVGCGTNINALRICGAKSVKGKTKNSKGIRLLRDQGLDLGTIEKILCDAFTTELLSEGNDLVVGEGISREANSSLVERRIQDGRKSELGNIVE
jgi:hypothetical protein